MDGHLIEYVAQLAAPGVKAALMELRQKGEKLTKDDIQIILLADISRTQHEMKEEMHDDHDHFTDGFDRLSEQHQGQVALLNSIQADIKTNQTLLVNNNRKR